METTKRRMLVTLGLALAFITPLSLHAQDASKPEAPVVKAATPAADPALILKAIPADATAFVVLRNAEELNEDVQTTWKNLKLPEGVVPNLVDQIRAGLNAGEQFNPAGSMALVVLNLAEVKTTDEIEGRLAILLPSTDPEAMAKAMGGEKDGDVIKLTFAGDPSFAGVKGSFLVITNQEAALKAVLQAKGDGISKVLSADRAKSFAQSDIYGWASFRGVSKELRDAAIKSIEESAGQSMPAMLTAIQKGNFEQINKIMDEGQEVAFGALLDSKRGLMMNFAMVMKPDTELGKQIAAMKPVTESLLVGLPSEPTIFAMGTVGNPSTGDQVRKMFNDLLKGEGIEEKVDKEKLGKVRDLLAQLAGSMQQMSMSVSGLPAEGGEGMVGVTLVGTVKNSQKFRAEAKELFTVGKDLIVDAAKKSGESEEDVKKVADAFQWKENAEKIGDASVDHLTFDMSKAPDADADTIEQINKVLGKEGVLIRVASVGPTHVVVSFGGGAKRFEAIAGLAAKGESPLSGSADIKKVADRVPAGAKLAEGYVSIDQLLTLVVNIGNEVGTPIPFPLNMRNAAPITVTVVKAGDTGQQFEVLVPMELMRSTADMVRPILGMMMGGGQPDAPEPAESGNEGGKLN